MDRVWALTQHLVPSTWPKALGGHPIVTIIIIKATDGFATPSQRVSVVALGGEQVQVGVPNDIRGRVVRLINLWDRPDPNVKVVKRPESEKSGKGEMMKEGEMGELRPQTKGKKMRVEQEREKLSR